MVIKMGRNSRSIREDYPKVWESGLYRTVARAVSIDDGQATTRPPERAQMTRVREKPPSRDSEKRDCAGDETVALAHRQSSGRHYAASSAEASSHEPRTAPPEFAPALSVTDLEVGRIVSSEFRGASREISLLVRPSGFRLQKMIFRVAL